MAHDKPACYFPGFVRPCSKFATRLTHCSHFCPTAFRLVPFNPLGKEAHARRPQHRHRIFLPVSCENFVQSNPTLHRTRNLWYCSNTIISGIATSIESLFDTALLTLCWRWWYVIRTNCCDVLQAVYHFWRRIKDTRIPIYPNHSQLKYLTHLSQLQATNSYLHISSSAHI